MDNEFVARAQASRGRWAPELAGRTAIVTGAGRLRSIGRSVALELARQGVNLVLTGTGRSPDAYPPEEKEIGWRDIESVREEAEALGVGALTCVSDASEPGAADDLVRRAIDRFGTVDIVVNNAGAARGGDRRDLTEVSFADWRRVHDVNLDGVFLTATAVARRMIDQGTGGAILNISSIASRFASAKNGAYSASKAAVNALSRTLALELAPHRIRVNSILPGVIETSRMDDLGRGEAWNAFVAQVTPLGVAGNGMEVAHLCTYLCSDMGAWITGQDIAVDGGASWH